MRAELWESRGGALFVFAVEGEAATWARCYGKGIMCANQDDETDAAEDLRYLAKGADPIAEEWPNWDANEDWDGSTPDELREDVRKSARLVLSFEACNVLREIA